MPTDLVAKYGEARIPRHTSYPTVLRFSDAIGASHYSDWIG
jgi:oxygen-independent coproporphyrinogen-3 oxidase